MGETAMGDCYSGMETEKLNPRTQNIDLCSAQEIEIGRAHV